MAAVSSDGMPSSPIHAVSWLYVLIMGILSTRWSFHFSDNCDHCCRCGGGAWYSHCNLLLLFVRPEAEEVCLRQLAETYVAFFSFSDVCLRELLYSIAMSMGTEVVN